MEVELTPDQQALVSDAIASGRLHRPEEAMQQALLLWEERERRRLEILAAVELSKARMTQLKFTMSSMAARTLNRFFDIDPPRPGPRA